MDKVVEYLKQREWSLGNKCPVCYGKSAHWVSMIGGENVGHEVECLLAAGLRDLGEKPLVKGGFAGDTEKVMSHLEIVSIAKKMLLLLGEREWNKRNCAENTYCVSCAKDDDEWEDQVKHHKGCQYVRVMNKAHKLLD